MSREKVWDRQSTDKNGLAVNRGIASGHYCPCPPFPKAILYLTNPGSMVIVCLTRR